ncbi:MAG: ferritin-like domain-containing protein [bacterium]|nr:ferritin-like domain-containing protein [bacterium]MCP5071652.1 ferritin-like domain-containing protein [bacterium]
MTLAIPKTPLEAEILTYSYYRDAEMRGSNLLFRLLRVLLDPASQMNLTQHLSDETRHAWLWTRRIRELGGVPVPINDGYQVRVGKRAGLTRKPIDLLALTFVAEHRAMARYQEHQERSDVSAETREVLEQVSADEIWHVGWIMDKARELAEAQGQPELVDAAVERFRGIDLEVMEELNAFEGTLLGRFED